VRSCRRVLVHIPGSWLALASASGREGGGNALLWLRLESETFTSILDQVRVAAGAHLRVRLFSRAVLPSGCSKEVSGGA